MKLFLTLWCFVLLYGCSPGGGNIQESELALNQAFEEKNCSQEVIQSYKNLVEKLKRRYSEREVIQKINRTITLIQEIGC